MAVMLRSWGGVAVAVLALLAAGPAHAESPPAPLTHPGAPGEPSWATGGADTITASGPCSGPSGWVISARASRRGIEVQVRISGPRGPWRVDLTHNGRPAGPGPGRGPRGPRGHGPGAHTPNLPGVDTYVMRAVNRASGEQCSGTLSY